MNGFGFYRGPRIIFGAGLAERLGGEASSLGERPLVVASRGWMSACSRSEALLRSLVGASDERLLVATSGEPSPELIDEVVARFRSERIGVVIAIGGGSALDAGKAISALLPVAGSAYDFLEGVGDRAHTGDKTPFIAVPTTAGSGSEATRNAVLSRVGENGFKRSIRHDRLVPDLALIDPELALSCPPRVTAACGMDALSQLLESYLSSAASPLTDALALDALGRAAQYLYRAYSEGGSDLEARAEMAYASLVSGMTLANAGLGVIHGLAAAIGAFFPVPHGAACGTLLAPAIKATVDKLRRSGEEGQPALAKLARAGCVLDCRPATELDRHCDLLAERLYELSDRLGIPPLSTYGIGAADCDRILERAGNKNNPIALEVEEMRAVLLERIG